MKMFKRLAAVLLAGAMVLAMLTACGSSIVRDTAQEEKAVELTQKLVTSLDPDITLEKDQALTDIAVATLPDAVDMYKAAIKQDKEAYTTAAQKAAQSVENKVPADQKHVAIIDVVPGELTEQVMQAEYAALMQQAQAGSFNFTPAKIGTAVTKQGDYTVFVIIVSE